LVVREEEAAGRTVKEEAETTGATAFSTTPP
jgi:hypothetical protein